MLHPGLVRPTRHRSSARIISSETMILSTKHPPAGAAAATEPPSQARGAGDARLGRPGRGVGGDGRPG